MFFQPLEDTNVLINQKGGFKEAPLFVREGKVFAKFAGAYRPLTSNKSVVGTNARWDCFEGKEQHRLKVGPLAVEYTLIAIPKAA